MTKKSGDMTIAKIIATVSVLAATSVLALVRAEPTPAQSLGAIKADYRRPAPRPVENQALVDLGRNLFFDTRISTSGKTSCASCHFPELGYVVTDAHPGNDSGKPTSRKSQPLIGIGHAGNAPVGWDGRSPTLEAQAKASIAGPNRKSGEGRDDRGAHQIGSRLRQSSS